MRRCLAEVVKFPGFNGLRRGREEKKIGRKKLIKTRHNAARICVTFLLLVWCGESEFSVLIFVVVDVHSFYAALFSGSPADSLRSHVILYE